ncbi:hypothetical protein [Sphingobium bisphenolivorans]|uniref:hypothetical protein n=1 Tax=Sphingobium bisphenolivorans TaxID=1335760 RepID=UPI0003A383E6|nr:hypothetical protein [Sphingobium bisphenolivorans]
MPADTDVRYLFRRAREEAAKVDAAVERRASAAEIAAHRELALRYKIRALAVTSPEQLLYEAMDKDVSRGDHLLGGDGHRAS